MIEQRYKNAERFLPENFGHYIRNATIDPYWVSADVFIYKLQSESGFQFHRFDCSNGVDSLVFDHVCVASVLSDYFDETVDSKNLPLGCAYSPESGVIEFIITRNNLGTDGKLYSLRLDREGGLYINVLLSPAGKPYSSFAVSPDKTKFIAEEQGNLSVWYRKEGQGEFLHQPLTCDGSPDDGYGCYQFYSDLLHGSDKAPVVYWSSDSRYFAVQRVNTTRVNDLSLHQSISPQGFSFPVNHNIKFASPGDRSIPVATSYIFDLVEGRVAKSSRESCALVAPMEYETLFWGDNNHLYQLEFSRGRKSVMLTEMEPVGGTTRVILEEKNNNFVFPGPFVHSGVSLIRVLTNSDEVIWYSHKEGWGQLYLHDLGSGELINKITCESIVVTWIHYVDIESRTIYFAASGEYFDCNPYYQFICKVKFNGSGFEVLTKEACSHEVASAIKYYYRDMFTINDELIGFSPAGDFFVETMGAVDFPSKTVVRRSSNGHILFELCDSECGDSLPLLTEISLKAEDGVSQIFGAMYRPSYFDENSKYPVILSIYGGPQFSFIPKFYGEAFNYVGGTHWALSELGFIVIVIDPRGTPLRSRAFQDFASGALGNGGGIDDQVYVLKALAEKFPWMDMDKVGVTGMSGGGYASARAMMTHPKLFKVGVSIAGNHDQRLFQFSWAETFHTLSGGDAYSDLNNSQLSQHLEGKLLLVHGDMDAIVHPANTTHLVDALIKNDRDFDMLMMPNKDHSILQDNYLVKRTWNYFVENLLEESPPKNYVIGRDSH